MLESGNLPMSSAEIASTIEVESFLMSIARSMPPRMPVTTTVSRFFASSAFFFSAVVSCAFWSLDAVDCACACAASNMVAEANATLSRFRFNCTIFPSRNE